MTLIKFYMDSCVPCKQMNPVVDAVVEETGVEYVKVDVDASPDIVTKYNVASVPTLVFEKDGMIVGQVVGVINKKALREKIESFLNN